MIKHNNTLIPTIPIIYNHIYTQYYILYLKSISLHINYMTHILSIDVGIKNLAYCSLSSTVSGVIINDWGIINIMEHINKTCSNTIRNKPCTRDAYHCIHKTGVSGTFFCNKKTCEKKMNQVYTKKEIKKQKRKTCKNIKLKELALILLTKLKEKGQSILDIDKVIIENQPVLKNPTMKSVQMILYTYFLDHGIMDNTCRMNDVVLFSARNKLKIYDGPEVECTLKNKYSRTKYLSVEYTKYFINDNTTWLPFFTNHSKKDDLADCYLQGLYYLLKK